MSGSGILGIGTSALGVFRQSLETISHNIANVNTEGYSRQNVEAGTRPPNFYGGQYVGTGVQVDAITRAFNQFVSGQLTGYTATNAYAQRYSALASQVDNLLSADGSALGPGLQSFFESVQGVATDPTSDAARQEMLSQGQALAGRFHSLDQQLDFLRQGANGDIGNLVSEINTLSAGIAKVNQAVANARTQGGGAPNDLLDKRDALINQLAGKVSVRTVAQDDGSLNVVIGNGLSLVTGNRANTLIATRLDGPVGSVDVGLKTDVGVVPVSDQISGGELGAVLEFRKNILTPAQNALGRVAVGLASSFNAQHEQGVDLNGQPGQAFFTLPQPHAFAESGNSGGTPPPTATIADASALTTDDYRLSYDGSAWTLTRLGSGQVVTMSGSGTAADPFVADGLDIVVPAGAAAGDRFVIQPTRGAAGDIDVALTDPAAIAAADASAGAGQVGDNRNALALAALQQKPTLAGGAASLGDAYQQLVTEIGTRTQSASSDADTQAALLTQAQNSRDSVSGVNLDEEAAAMLKYQQAYQAAAQVIATADQMFQTLLDATRR